MTILLSSYLLYAQDTTINLYQRLRFKDINTLIAGKNGFLDNEMLMGDRKLDEKEFDLLLNLINKTPKHYRKISVSSLLILLNTIPLSAKLYASDKLKLFLNKYNSNFYSVFFKAKYLEKESPTINGTKFAKFFETVKLFEKGTPLLEALKVTALEKKIQFEGKK